MVQIEINIELFPEKTSVIIIKKSKSFIHI